MLIDLLKQAALEAGATAVGVTPVSEITFDPAFRDMCAANSCGKYGKCYMCPPDVGDINDLINEAKSYKDAFVFQYIAALEDSFDIEGMHEAKERFRAISFVLRDAISEHKDHALLLGAGGCGVCEECNKPKGLPCKAPDLATPSLEAYGVHVSKLAPLAGMKYINGPDTVTYFGAVLLK